MGSWRPSVTFHMKRLGCHWNKTGVEKNNLVLSFWCYSVLFWCYCFNQGGCCFHQCWQATMWHAGQWFFCLFVCSLSLLMKDIYRLLVAFASAFPHSYLLGRGLNVDLGVERHLHKCCLWTPRPVRLLSPEHLNLNDWHCCLKDVVFPAEKLH